MFDTRYAAICYFASARDAARDAAFDGNGSVAARQAARGSAARR